MASGKRFSECARPVRWYAGNSRRRPQPLAQIAWAGQQPRAQAGATLCRNRTVSCLAIGDGPQVTEQLLTCRPLKALPFDPQGRHHTNLVDWAAFWRPLGQPGDPCLDLNVTAAMALLLAAQDTKDERYLAAARQALDASLKWDRPEGGDWWETPLYSPNLLAAGNAAIAYYLGYRVCGDERYLERAIHHIRGMLPFTHLWQPADITMLYNTKPCLNSTCWYLSDWVSKHVIWEVLRVFQQSRQLGIDC